MKRVQLLSIGMLVEVVVVLLGEKLVMMVMVMMIPGVGGGGQDACDREQMHALHAMLARTRQHSLSLR